jgi:uncharacterized protein involved in exopolysaccharide biosynthesis
MNRDRGEISLLKADVDAAQKAFDIVSASEAQARLQAVNKQTNSMKLAPAVEPTEGNGLGAPAALLAALGVGTLLGLAGVMLLELINRRVRNAGDLAAIGGLPTLAVVPTTGNARVRAPQLGHGLGDAQ